MLIHTYVALYFCEAEFTVDTLVLVYSSSKILSMLSQCY